MALTWGTEQENVERFRAETLSTDQYNDLCTFGFCFREKVRSILDDGTQLLVLERFYREEGQTKSEEIRFMHPDAFDDAAFYVSACFDAAEHDYSFDPYGLEWGREQEERRLG